MSWKNLIFKDEEGSQEQPVAETQETAQEEAVAQEVQEPVANENYQFSYSTSTTSTVGTVSEEIEKHLWEVLDQNKKSMAYFDFLKAKRAMDTLPLDEAAKFQATFVSLSTQGLTKDGLLDSISEHLGVLEGEKESYNSAVEEKISEEIGSREYQIQENESTIEEMSNKIKELTESIQGIQQENIGLKNEINEQNLDINSKRLNFEATVAEVQKELNDHKQQVELYLSQGNKEEENEQQ